MGLKAVKWAETSFWIFSKKNTYASLSGRSIVPWPNHEDCLLLLKYTISIKSIWGSNFVKTTINCLDHSRSVLKTVCQKLCSQNSTSFFRICCFHRDLGQTVSYLIMLLLWEMSYMHKIRIFYFTMKMSLLYVQHYDVTYSKNYGKIMGIVWNILR